MFYRRQRPDGTYGKTYWTRINGQRVSTGCTDLRAAEAWRRVREREAADPTYLRAKSARLEDAVSDFLAELRRRGRAPKTIEKNQKKLGHILVKWGDDFPLGSVDARLVSSYIDERLTEQGIRKGEPVSRLTIRDELVAIRQVLTLARRHGQFAAHPDDVMPVRWETKHKPKKDWIKEKDLEKLLAKLPARRAAHLLYFVCCAGRLADSFISLREDWHLTPKGKETVLVRGGKTPGSWRTNPITPFLLPWVRRMLKDAPGKTVLFDPWLDGNLGRDLKAACKRAGVAPVSTNGLRRSFGMWHRIRGYDLDSISKLFGHTTAKLVRDVYADVGGEELRAAMKASRRKAG
jgi:integrase